MEELELFLFTRVNHRNRVAPRSRHVKALESYKRKQEECLGMVSTDEGEGSGCPGRGSLGL